MNVDSYLIIWEFVETVFSDGLLVITYELENTFICVTCTKVKLFKNSCADWDQAGELVSRNASFHPSICNNAGGELLYDAQ